MNFNLIIPCSLLHGFRMSFWLVQNTFDPSLEKRGKGRFMENRFIQKIPLNPPLPKGENARKDSRQAGMTKKTKIHFVKHLQLPYNILSIIKIMRQPLHYLLF